MSDKNLNKTPRTRVKRNHTRGVYDRERAYEVLDSGYIAHIGYVVDGQPFVTPTFYWREGDHVYWHGSAASRMLKRQSEGIPVCLTVSHIDGLVLARSAFHHSVNYRSVMLVGEAFKVTGAAEKTEKLKTFLDGMTPGRWDSIRPMTSQELKATTVLGMEIDEGSAKIRDGGPIDDEEDYDLPIWAGVAPMEMRMGAFIPDERQHADAPKPPKLGGPFAAMKRFK